MDEKQGVVRCAQLLRKIHGYFQRQHKNDRSQPKAQINRFACLKAGHAVAQAPKCTDDEQHFNDIHGPVGQRKRAFYKGPALNVFGVKAAQAFNQLGKGACGLSH